ncbi:MAG TPA: C4-type zinc ribbon domain-containing protein [Dehalococcoidia bacterium]|nr:C4-type zinc ribbon domain-containing protein [Dehalococcoidia bacterium]
MTSAADLFALQEIDLKRDTRRALLADIESRLGETEELLTARERLNEALAEAEHLRRDQRELEASSADLDAKIQPMEKKLYDGSVRNPKELTDLQREVASLKGRRSKLDDQGLALIDSIEAANAAVAEARSEYERTESAWQADQEELRSDQARAERESSQLEGERGLRSQGMDAGSLGLYETLRRAKQGRGVARVERGTCQGCRVTLPTHLVQRVRTGGVLIQCPSCERILVAG